MAQLEATSGSNPLRSVRPLSLSDFLRDGRIWLAAMALLIVYQGAQILGEYEGIGELIRNDEVPVLDGSDFPAFYGGTRLFLDDPFNAYAELPQTQAIYAAKGLGEPTDGSHWYRYYNPPVYSLLLSPLTLLEIHTAYAVTLVLNFIGLILLIRVLFLIYGRRDHTFMLLAAAVLTSIPVNYAFWHAQPTLFLAALTGLSYLELERGRERLSGIYWALCAIKPHWLLFQGAVLLR